MNISHPVIDCKWTHFQWEEILSPPDKWCDTQMLSKGLLFRMEFMTQTKWNVFVPVKKTLKQYYNNMKPVGTVQGQIMNSISPTTHVPSWLQVELGAHWVDTRGPKDHWTPQQGKSRLKTSLPRVWEELSLSCK